MSIQGITDLSDAAAILRFCRDQSGFRQGEFAERLGIHQASLSAMEMGKSSPNAKLLLLAIDVAGFDMIIQPKEIEAETEEEAAVENSNGTD